MVGWVKVHNGHCFCRECRTWFTDGWKFYRDALTSTASVCEGCAEAVAA